MKVENVKILLCSYNTPKYYRIYGTLIIVSFKVQIIFKLK